MTARVVDPVETLLGWVYVIQMWEQACPDKHQYLHHSR